MRARARARARDLYGATAGVTLGCWCRPWSRLPPLTPHLCMGHESRQAVPGSAMTTSTRTMVGVETLATLPNARRRACAH